MTAAEESRLRITLLQTLRAAGALGLPEGELVNAARLAGFDVTLPELMPVLRNLVQDGLVSRLDTITGRRARLTDLGADKLREAGL